MCAKCSVAGGVEDHGMKRFAVFDDAVGVSGSCCSRHRVDMRLQRRYVARQPDHPHAPASWNTASLYTPLNHEPAGFDGRRRYVHVIGPKVLVSDDPGDPLWASHFIGPVGEVGWWAVDAPLDERSDGDPSTCAVSSVRSPHPSGSRPAVPRRSCSGCLLVASVGAVVTRRCTWPEIDVCGVRVANWSAIRGSRLR